ncbi:hypothetical protein GCM10022225_37270 [Plantactinospora mayteni]|uniref:Transposase n=1 Tax=Plantactinospora mayteni TaxID=566021 RepID=A0ABQ4EKP9_9ACTN|nr:hypothetical protein Pma05_18800 [Plantactinospora mayteni]
MFIVGRRGSDLAARTCGPVRTRFNSTRVNTPASRYDRLAIEHSFTEASYSTVRNYVARRRPVQRGRTPLRRIAYPAAVSRTPVSKSGDRTVQDDAGFSGALRRDLSTGHRRAYRDCGYDTHAHTARVRDS